MSKSKSAKGKAGKVESEDCDENTDGVLFWVNKSGFPIVEPVWQRMYTHASKLHPAGDSVVMALKGSEANVAVSIPRPPPANTLTSPTDQRVQLVQKYMNELQYNHTGTQFFDIKKYRNLAGLNETAREMMRESLPIKCLEAVILGIYLTNGCNGLERFPLSFKTVFNGNTHRHVVLALHWNGLYGALGMSRRDDLMYKSFMFTSLADLVIEYIESYNQYWHKVNKTKIGFPVSHENLSHEPIHWKGLSINPSKMSKSELRQAIEKHVKDIKAWIRQAPFSSVYAPRGNTVANTASHGVPNKKSRNMTEESRSALELVALMNAAPSTSNSSNTERPQTSQTSKTKNTPFDSNDLFEMRI